MDSALVQQWITRWEDSRSRVYLDTKGIPTIGIGLNMTTKLAKNAIAGIGGDYDALLAGTAELSQADIGILLGVSIEVAVSAIRYLVPNFDQLPADKQLVLTDLCFNMGEPVLAEFVHALNYVNMGQWTRAAMEFESSAWYKEVGQRGRANVAVMAGTATPESILAA